LTEIFSQKKISLIQLIGIIFFNESGGAFGLEDLVSSAGPGLAMLFLIATPLIQTARLAEFQKEGLRGLFGQEKL
jgi:hypothetical protein